MSDHLWQSTAFAAAAALVAFALRRHQASTRFWVWFAASVKFLVPFSVLVTAGRQLAWLVPSHLSVIEIDQFSRLLFVSTAFAPEAAVFIGWADVVVVGVWAAGAAIIFTVWLSRWRRMARVVRIATMMNTGREAAILARLQQTFGAPRRVRLLRSNASHEPILFGVVRPALVWPQCLSAHLGDDHVEAIIAHELSHLRRRDNLLASIHMLVEATFWFHPLVWFIGRRLDEERERACDETVIELGSEPRAYAQSILRTCEACLASPLPNAAGITGADLKKRVERIMTGIGGTKRTRLQKTVLVILLLVAVSLPIVIGTLLPRSATEESTIALDDPESDVVGGQQPGTPYKIGDEGVQSPRLLREVKPQYTPEAIAARIQGRIVLECVIRTDGRPDDFRIVRSLDPGLDQQAIDAARQWMFDPGTRNGQPVPVAVTVEIQFTLR